MKRVKRVGFWANVKWLPVLAVALVLGSLAVLLLLPAYSAFGIGLGLAAIVFGLLARTE